PGGAAGETCRETLLRKASEPAAHVAGFGWHWEGFGPPSLPKGGFRRSEGAASPFLCYPQRRRRPARHPLRAMASISNRASLGRAATATHERAGLVSPNASA